MTIDRAREEINKQMPWLGLDTERDLIDYFDCHRVYRRHRSRLADLWERRAV